MHGAAQTANAPPRSAPEPRRRAPASRPGRQHALRHGQEADEREPEHDEDEARDLRRRALPRGRCPTAAAPAPRTTKTTVKPKMNGMLETTTRRAVAALAEPAGLDARDRREVAGDERQHARHDDRDEAGRERDRRACRPSVEACQQIVEATLGLLVEPGARRLVRLLGLLAPAPAPDAEREDERSRRARLRSAATTRAGRSPCATAPRGSAVRSWRRAPTRCCCAVQHAAIFFEMNASISSAAGDSDMSSVVWQVGHITWPWR